MTLKERALQANKDKIRSQEDKNAQAVSQRLERVQDPDWWQKEVAGVFGRDDVPPVPTEVRWGKANISQRDQLVERNGVLFEIDNVPFIFLDSANGGLRVIATCPDCGIEQAYTFYGLEALGAILTEGRSVFGHKCRQMVTKSLAYEIGSAARKANTSVDNVIREALRHADELYKGQIR